MNCQVFRRLMSVKQKKKKLLSVGGFTDAHAAVAKAAADIMPPLTGTFSSTQDVPGQLPFLVLTPHPYRRVSYGAKLQSLRDTVNPQVQSLMGLNTLSGVSATIAPKPPLSTVHLGPFDESRISCYGNSTLYRLIHGKLVLQT